MFHAIRSQWEFLNSSEAFRCVPVRVLARLCVWYGSVAAAKASLTADLPAWRVRMKLPVEKRGAGKVLYAFRESYDHELRFLLNVLAPSDVFVDVGANYGMYAIAAGAKAAKIIAFEPAQHAYTVLAENIRLNGLTNVVLYRAAVGDEPGLKTLYHHPDCSRNSLVQWDGGSGSEQVRVVKLSEALRQANVSSIDAMKIDVEGGEELVLRGAVEEIKRSLPLLIFEMNSRAARAFGLEPGAAAAILLGLGYGLFTCGHDGCLVPLGELRDGNMVAIHPDGKKREYIADAAQHCALATSSQ